MIMNSNWLRLISWYCSAFMKPLDAVVKRIILFNFVIDIKHKIYHSFSISVILMLLVSFVDMSDRSFAYIYTHSVH